MRANRLVARFRAREAAMLKGLRALPAPLLRALPVSVDALVAARATLKEEAVVAAFAKALRDRATPLCVNFEWYYDGGDAAESAEGRAYAACQRPLSFSGTDLVKVGRALGVESRVTFASPTEGGGTLEIGRVLKTQHKISKRVDEVYLHILAEKLMPAMTEVQRLRLPDLQQWYEHLFHLQLYRLLNEASAGVDERASYIFVGTHERWPVLVATPPDVSAKKRRAVGAR